jgi:integrase/recombinase XerD
MPSIRHRGVTARGLNLILGLLLIVLAVYLQGCKKEQSAAGTADHPISNKFIPIGSSTVNSNVVKIDTVPTLQNNLLAVDTLGGLTFSASADLKKLKVGMILNSAPSAVAPGGFLQRIESIQKLTNGSYYCTASLCSLSDAIQNCSVVQSFSLHDLLNQNNSSLTNSNLGASKHLATVSVSVGDNFSLKHDFGVFSMDGQILTQGTVTTTLTMALFKIQEFKIDFKTTDQASIAASVTQSFNASVEAQLIKYPVTIINVFTLFTSLVPDVHLSNITTETVTAFFKVLEQRKRIVGRSTVKMGIKKSTVATYWGKLNSFLSWLQARNHIAANPFAAMKYPAPKYEDRKFLKKSEVEKIFAAIYIHHNDNLLLLKRNIALFHILLFCGLRREELLQLQIRDIDMERHLLTIRSETSKSGISRQLPLNSNVITALMDYFLQRKKYTCQYLFVSNTIDRQFTSDGLNHLVLRTIVQSGVRFHLHQFRHTFAINFLKQSNNLFMLKELLGHRDISMTALYLRCLPVDEMRNDMAKMSIDKLL